MAENMTNDFEYLPKNITEEHVYTVAEAMRLTGLSSTKFRYEPNKRELDARGADLSQRVWRIPRSVLIDMGWLSPDAPLTAEPAEGEGVTMRSSVARIKQLAEENSALKAELSNLREELESIRTLLVEKDTLLAAANATIKAKDAEIANLMTLLNR